MGCKRASSSSDLVGARFFYVNSPNFKKLQDNVLQPIHNQIDGKSYTYIFLLIFNMQDMEFGSSK
jgi:hypothetical protein